MFAAKQILVHHQQYSDIPPPTSPYITAYIDTASMPPHVREMVGGLTEGFHEAYRGRDEYHIAVQSLPNLDKFLYLLYDVSGLEFTEKRKLNIGFVLAAGVILVIALGLWIGWLTSRKVMAPVSHFTLFSQFIILIYCYACYKAGWSLKMKPLTVPPGRDMRAKLHQTSGAEARPSPLLRQTLARLGRTKTGSSFHPLMRIRP